MSGVLSPLFTWRTAIAKSDLPPTVRLVAFALSLYMNERGGSAWPSITTLASDSGLSVASVKRGTKALERAGFLVCKRQEGLSTHYTATVPTQLAFPQEEVTQNRAQSEPGSEGYGTGLTLTPDPAHSEPLPRQYHAMKTPKAKTPEGATVNGHKRNPFAISPEQGYLIGQILDGQPGWRSGKGALTYPGVVKLIKAQGNGAVTEALQELWLRVQSGDIAAVRSPYPYLEQMAKGEGAESQSVANQS